MWTPSRRAWLAAALLSLWLAPAARAQAQAQPEDRAQAQAQPEDRAPASMPAAGDAPAHPLAVTDEAAARSEAVEQAPSSAPVAGAEESDNPRRALYAGIGMGALGALAVVASTAMSAGAAIMVFAPGVDDAIRTQGAPLLWFGLSGVLVGAVMTAAGSSLIGWSLWTVSAPSSEAASRTR
jgi:hypothetical protein